MKSIDTSLLQFRRFEPADVPMVHRWLNAPHVRPWFGGEHSLEDVAEEYAEFLDPDQPIRAYIIVYDGRSIGWLNWERFGDSPAFQAQYGVEDPDSVNCDMLIGEADVAHRGWGATILREFLRRIVFVHPHVTSCIIDPVPDNSFAIRMYEKAGFQFVRAAPDDGEGNGLYLMELKRVDLEKPIESPTRIYLRPARVDEIATAEDIDDDACSMFAEIGLPMDIDEAHAFAQHEIKRWTEAAKRGRLLFACAPSGEAVGFAAFDLVDEKPYLDQISVRRAWQSQGIGRALVARAIAWSVRPGELWITTYNERVPWNGPWYQRLGFVAAGEGDIGPELAMKLAAERSVLPEGHQRIAMVYRHRVGN